MNERFPQVEFRCCDCGGNVLQVGVEQPPHPPRCFTCEWIAANIDPAHYQAIRMAMAWAERRR